MPGGATIDDNLCALCQEASQAVIQDLIERELDDGGPDDDSDQPATTEHKPTDESENTNSDDRDSSEAWKETNYLRRPTWAPDSSKCHEPMINVITAGPGGQSGCTVWLSRRAIGVGDSLTIVATEGFSHLSEPALERRSLLNC